MRITRVAVGEAEYGGSKLGTRKNIKPMCQMIDAWEGHAHLAGNQQPNSIIRNYWSRLEKKKKRKEKRKKSTSCMNIIIFFFSHLFITCMLVWGERFLQSGAVLAIKVQSMMQSSSPLHWLTHVGVASLQSDGQVSTLSSQSQL
jgi:hypothetical protein